MNLKTLLIVFVAKVAIVAGAVFLYTVASAQETKRIPFDGYRALGWCTDFVDQNYTGILHTDFAPFMRDACAFGYEEGYARGYEEGYRQGARQ
jgi:hypothetical protein